MAIVRDLIKLKAPPTDTQQAIVWLRHLYDVLRVSLATTIKRLGTGSVTLTASTASTVVSNDAASSASIVLLDPTTSNAKLEIEGKLDTDGPGAYVSSRTTGSFTITHTNHASADRTFNYVILE